MSEEELLDMLADFASAVESAAVKLKRDIYDLVQKLNDAKSWDPDKIVWTKAESQKGMFEKATATANEGNADFNGLLADLKARGGKMRKGSYFYWTFEMSETPTVGRKLVKRKA